MLGEGGGEPAACEFGVNGVGVFFRDYVVTGREVLTHSGNVPASEYQLVLVHGGRTRLVGTDDEVDLRSFRGGEFRAFQSDRDYAFTVDEVGQVWGAAEMDVDDFLRIWPARAGHFWLLEREDVPDTVLTAGGVLSFGPEGVEHVISRKDEHPDKVLVTVVTTAGVFPNEGVARYAATTPIAAVLADARKGLHIAEVPADWVVTVNNVDVGPGQTFEQAHLSGSVKLEWGPREGGGGA